MGERIVIVGTASTSIGRAPWDDPDVQFWTVGSLLKHWPEVASRINLWFEIHPHFMDLRPEWLDWAKIHQPHVYMAEVHADLEHSKAFPLDEVKSRFGGYFTSSVAYMLALAIMEKPQQIGLYGVDMAVASEYYDQRPCCEYMIGLARGMGIEVHIPDASPLLKSPWLYGYDRHSKTPKNRDRDDAANWRAAALALRDKYDPSFAVETLVQQANGGLVFTPR